MATTPPYLASIDGGADFFAVPDMRDVSAIEIAATRDAAEWWPMAALVRAHYDLVHTAGPQDLLRAMPLYFSRRANGLRLHPTADKQYWIRVTYRAPVGHAIPADRLAK